jgi:hypothetical protein
MLKKTALRLCASIAHTPTPVASVPGFSDAPGVAIEDMPLSFAGIAQKTQQFLAIFAEV